MNELNSDQTVLAELVSYLDGELGDEAREQVERRMAVDGEYRQQLLQLQKSWDLLDDLPRTPVSDQFAHSTVEMVAVQASQAVIELKKDSQQQRSWLWYFATAGVVLGFLAGYLVMHSFTSKTNDRLVQDLPIIENVDIYDYVESVEFLSDLEESGLFSEEDANDSL